LEGFAEVSVAGAWVQQDDGHLLPPPLKLQGHGFAELVQGSLAGAVSIPTPQPVVCDAAHLQGNRSSAATCVHVHAEAWPWLHVLKLREHNSLPASTPPVQQPS
jgi:hypothetical protein